MENTVDQNKEKDGKKRFLILIILVAGLGLFSIFAGYKAFYQDPIVIQEATEKNDINKSRAEKLKMEMNKVNSMLETIGFEGSEEGMENLSEEHIAIRKEAEEQKKKLENLQSKMKELIALSEGGATDADSFIDAYRKLKAAHWKLNNEVSKLKRRNRQLKAENKKLTTENVRLAEEVEKQKQSTELLEEESKILRKKVEKAAVLNVQDLNVDGIRIVRSGREKTSSKARKVEKIRVGFTLPKNEVTNPGLKTIYLVLTGPDKQVLTDGGSNFNYEGGQLAYTVYDQVNYKNKPKDVMMYGKNLFKKDFDKGIYKVEIYCEGAKIGSTQLELK